MFGLSEYSDVVPEMTEGEIRAAIEQMDSLDTGAEWLVTRIYDQQSEGSCVANANAQGNECLQAYAYGPANVIPLSAISLYKRIGRTPQSGATISDGCEEHLEGGILPLDTPSNRSLYGDHVMPNTGFYRSFPSGWTDTAHKFRLAEYHIVRTVNGLMTALCSRHPVIVGRQGHSICYLRPSIDSRNNYLAVYANSWNSSWGFAAGSMEGGFGADSENQIRKSASWAVAMRTIIARA